jgi:SAM-dependent methyltransferase
MRRGMAPTDMGLFWDERAREDAYYFVDNRLDYRSPDVDRFWAGGDEALQKLLEIAGAAIQPGDTIVDVGCGVGRLTRAAAGVGARVLAVDVSEEMLKRARDLNGELDDVQWIHGDGRTLEPLSDGIADGCISMVVFQHIPDPRITLGYIHEIGRVLRPGGWAAVQLSTDPGLHRPNQGWRDRVRSLAGRAPRGQWNPAWVGSGVEVADLTAAVAEAGMTLENLVSPGTQYTTVLTVRN